MLLFNLMAKLYYNPFMKKLTIEDKTFNLKDIKQLYPAAEQGMVMRQQR